MSAQPTFDSLARNYAWLERLTYGNRLQWCRTVLMPRLGDCRKALILGDGDGRFVVELVKANPLIVVDSVDISSQMLNLARRRVAVIKDAAKRVNFHLADALVDPLPSTGYDLVVTNFFLDCFTAEQLGPLIRRVASHTRPGAYWVVGDFSLPKNGWSRIAACAALAGMYAFFRLTTGILPNQLVDPNPFLTTEGFRSVASETRLKGFLSAQLWLRTSERNTVSEWSRPFSVVDHVL